MSKITIYRDDVWAGDGRIDSDGCIVDCAAILGHDQDASDETYALIEGAVSDDPDGRGSIQRPDGVYSWVIAEDPADPRADAEYPYHVEVHTRRDGAHLEDVCDDYRSLSAAREAAAEMSAEWIGGDYYCQITLGGRVIEEKSCKEWAGRG